MPRLLARISLVLGFFLAVAGLSQSVARAQPLPQTQDAPDPDRLRLARLVVVDSGLARSFHGLVEQMQAEVQNRAATTQPEAVADLRAVLIELQPEFDVLANAMTDRAAAFYANRLSRRELADCAVFFAGPSGKAYVAAQPALIDDLAAALAEWRGQAAVTIMTRVREKMREKGRAF
jgi:uncharacterized protein